MTAGVAVTAIAAGAAGVEHAPGWKHPLPGMVTVDEKVKSEALYCTKNAGFACGPILSVLKSIEGPPGKQETMPGNFEM